MNPSIERFRGEPGVPPAHDHRVCELTQLRLTLRTDLRFTPHYESGERCYLVEDLARTQFYQVGISEYLLISMFDGNITVSQALARLGMIDAQHTLTTSDVMSICKWLVDSGLATTTDAVDSHQIAKAAAEQRRRKRLATMNPLCMKMPLAYPDRFFSQVVPWLEFLFGRSAAGVMLVVTSIAFYQVVINWTRFLQASEGIFSPGRWFWLALCWFGLKAIHECSHAVVCRKYGGRVHEAGAIFVLFAPLAYVDLTSAWRFRSKWHRIHTAIAGMYSELFVAAVAAIVWSSTSPGTLNDLCFNVVVMASVTTILFNANPLMRFDGYFVLSDFLEIPNLYGEGQRYLQCLGQRVVFGEKLRWTLSWSPRDTFIRFYAVAAFAWRIVICLSLTLTAAVMFHGLGILIALVAIGLWAGVPLLKLMRHLRKPDGLHRKRQMRFLVASALGILVVMGASSLRSPLVTTAPVVVQYEAVTHVRAASPGFVKDILVNEGDAVEQGQPIVRLENVQLIAECRDLELAIEQSELKCRVFRQEEQMHFYQAEMDQLQSLIEKLAEKQAQADQLTICALTSGRIIARNLPAKVGTYLHVGDEIAVIGNDVQKELQLAICQGDYEQFTRRVGSQIRVRLTGGVVFTCELDRLEPRATKRAPHESMYAAFGGRLESQASSDEETAGDVELLAAHFTGRVTLSPEQSKRLCVGQRGVVSLGRSEKTVGHWLGEEFRAMLPESLSSVLGQLVY